MRIGAVAILASATLSFGTQSTFARSAVEPQMCSGAGAAGWTFSAHVSLDDGLVLDDSSLNGRQFTESASVPYLDGLYTDYTKPAPATVLDLPTGPASRPREHRLELTPTPDTASPGVIGSTLTEFDCEGTGDGDIYVRAVYLVDDSSMYGSGPGGMLRYGTLQVTQEYRFRGMDDHACEPTRRLGCARFWPTLRYEAVGHPRDYATCSTITGDAPTCTAFRGVRTVQRLKFRPDGHGDGGVDAFRDRSKVDVAANRGNPVETKGSDGSMKYEDVDQAIRGGERGDWDSIHQSPTAETTAPGVDLKGLAPGCSACVHIHWVWDDSVNAPLPPAYDTSFTDGRPQILDGSLQNADFGIVRFEAGEEDPVERGWRSLVDEKGSDASMLRGEQPVIFWEMTSGGSTDSTFPVLDNYRHGGNGALFFGSHQH